eukprot:3317746-Rhodomonas_salina.1
MSSKKSTKKSEFVDVSRRKKSEALWELDANAESREGYVSAYQKTALWHFNADEEAWNPLNRREAGTIPRPASPVIFAKEQVDRRLEGEEEAEVLLFAAALDVMKILRKLDKDGGGTISMVELNAAFSQLKISPDPDLVEVLMRDYDEDNSGELDFEEFIPMYKELTKLMKARDEQDKDFIDAPNVGDKVLVPKEGQSMVLADIIDVSIVQERSQYTVKLKDGEQLIVGRASVFTLKEAGVPHEEIDRHELLPALSDVRPPSPRTLFVRGFKPHQYKDCHTFCQRHAFRMSSWCKGAVTSQGLSVHSEFIALNEEEARALLEGNRHVVDSIRQRLQPLVNSYLNRKHGVLVRLETTSPADQIIWDRCALTAMVMEVGSLCCRSFLGLLSHAHAWLSVLTWWAGNMVWGQAKEAMAAVANLKMHHSKGTVVNDVIIAAAGGMEVGQVPSKAHIKHAAEQAKHKVGSATCDGEGKMQSVGQRRL